MKFTIFKLSFNSPVHFGDARDDYSISLKTISSDTLYAALISCLAKLGKSIPDNGELGCTVSSLFPFYQDVLFFPKPINQSLPELEDLTAIKKIKKVSWIDKEYFEETINGKPLFQTEEDIKNIHGIFLSKSNIPENIIDTQISPRVKVSRAGEDATPFYMEKVLFKDNSGLFFIAVGDTSLLKPALDLLQCEGIGTDRNIGNGFFEYEEKEVDITLPEESDYILSLSSFIPETKEQLSAMLDSKNIAYDFQRRGGWITTPPFNKLRKNVIYAFTAGSVFAYKSSTTQIIGKNVDLNPNIDFEPKIEHPIWRCGKSIFIPIKI